MVNQCSNVTVRVKRPATLLVPTNKDLGAPVSPPTESTVDHFLCYRAASLTKLPKGTQVDVADQFQSRRYDLKKLTKLCIPVAKSGTPILLAGPDKGDPKIITPAAIQHASDLLVCYRATLAKTFIAQNGCGAATPGDKGTALPKQPRHTRRNGIYVNNQFGPGQLDSLRETELCIPSLEAQ